jgi:hypothetical protein
MDASRNQLSERDERLSRDGKYKKPATVRKEQAKMRACLICKRKFLSAWSGQRVCRQCTSTSAWRDGVL